MKFQFDFPSSVVRFSKTCSSLAMGLALSGLALPTLCADDNNRAPSGRAGAASSLELETKHGPWLVFAMSFDGKDSKALAEQFATELRRDHRLQAYCTPLKLDFTQPTTGAGFDTKGNTRKMKYLDKRVVNGYCVLVGDFDSVDSQAATDTLATVKAILKKKYEDNNNKTGTPLNAFITRNTLLPVDFFQTPAVDKFVKKLNEEKQHADFNLLNCPGKFTVRVAAFSGEDRSIGGWGGSGNHKNIDDQKVSQLELAAEKAALATKALRLAGYEAYQFHDRTQSIVTVGSFNTLGKEDQRKNFTYEPLMQDIINRFSGSSQVTRTKYGATQTPRILIDMIDAKKFPELSQGDEKSRNLWAAKYSIPFDIKPTPIAVPKAATTSIYSGSLLGSDRR